MDNHCSNCGTEILNQSPKCPNCGEIQDSFTYKSRIAAASMAVFAGIFGCHRFYLGQWWGVFYLLFFWTYIPWLVALIEGIIFLSTSQQNWNKKYNQGISAGSEKGTVVVVMICIFPIFAVLGILAAIAIPAYQDYTSRVTISQLHSSALVTQQAVEEYATTYQQWPTNYAALDIEQPVEMTADAILEVEGGIIYAQPPSSTGMSGALIYIPTAHEHGISWDCTESTIETKHLPKECQ